MNQENALSVYRKGQDEVRSVDIVFVHGLMGSAASTWAHSGGAEAYWPLWLSKHANIWVVDYPAELFWWNSSGAGMELPDRARSVLDYLVNFGVGQRPIIFITHSLGGLLVKAMLRAANDSKNRNWKRLLQSTKGIVFLGTPHTGASLGTLAELLKRVFGLSVNATQLASNSAHLRDLATWYSNNARSLRIESLAYYEKGNIKGIRVVDEASANPNVEGCEPVPSDANHLDICKPKSNTDPVYMGVLRFVEKFTGDPSAANRSAPQTPYTVDNIFGIHRGDTCHYVARDKVDNEFITNLIGGKHLCIYGSSKQGKTALRKQYIGPTEELAVVCDRNWTGVDILIAILKAAKCELQKNASDPEPGAYHVTIPTTREELSIHLTHTADFLRALEKSFSGKYVVVEEFHYLAEHVQRDLAFKLKAIHELSTVYIFIVIGVWLESNRLVHLNKDLVGRVGPINADEWNEADLLRVVLEGERKLNIVFPPGFAEKLIERACGSVFLVREACRRACVAAGIFAASEQTVLLDQTLNVGTILKELVKQGVDYPGQIVSLFDLDDFKPSERESDEGLKEWVLRSLVCATPKELQNGVTIKRLRAQIRSRHPRNYHPTETQIERVITAVQSAQLARLGQNLFDYDRQEAIVRCVDKGFILWRTGTSPDKIEHLIFEGEMPHEP